MNSRKTIGLILVAVGILAILYSALADLLGSSATPSRFGYVQLGGIVGGVAILILGISALVSPPPESALPSHGVRRNRAVVKMVNAASAILSLLFALVVSEGIARNFSYVDPRGQLYLLNRPLKPYTLPVSSVSEQIDEYLESESSSHPSYLMYDPNLGWTLRPNSVSSDGLHRANAAGFRDEVDYDFSPPPEVVRIAIFGDSFSHGSYVSFEESWGYRLEVLLEQEGLDVEVLNFGVPGYGMDQAFLRWQYDGSAYSPDFVLFGFQPGDVIRNLNTFRPFLQTSSSLPFFKPRFVLDGEKLSLVGSPTIPPEEVPDAVAHFAESPLAEHEVFFDPDDYVEHWWLESRILALAAEAFDPGPGTLRQSRQVYEVDSEAARLTMAILQAFETDVEAQGAQFVVVHLPRERDLREIAAGRLQYAELLEQLEDNFALVHTEDEFVTSRLGSYFVYHYTAEGNDAVAQAVAKDILEMVRTPEAGTGE